MKKLHLSTDVGQPEFSPPEFSLSVCYTKLLQTEAEKASSIMWIILKKSTKLPKTKAQLSGS
ncbi:hypothetical protein RchiOBHm_Chr5g0048311 [Rosa chinensis]|uniref:Uncharacterized protein n=1 Tax=Rosa chinensis TaxID=74649 RepID=A0A2P6QEM0_ROSCH|nr:hypothetical protein RchiOBHm_Chr5g0048311 [Rosa chinensis]